MDEKLLADLRRWMTQPPMEFFCQELVFLDKAMRRISEANRETLLAVLEVLGVRQWGALETNYSRVRTALEGKRREAKQ